jgi:glutathione S-transferase
MDATTPLRLYVDKFWISPYAFSCFVALHEKQLPFEVVPLSLGDGEHRRTDYAERTLTARVPALEHGDFVLSESTAIVEYLEEAFPAPGHARTLPTDLRARARARQVMAWLRSDLLALREERPTTTIFYERATAPLGDAASAAADKLLAVASRLVPDGGTPMFGSWCVADSDLAFALQRLVANGHDVGAKLSAYVTTEWARPSVRAFVERERPTFVPY